MEPHSTFLLQSGTLEAAQTLSAVISQPSSAHDIRLRAIHCPVGCATVGSHKHVPKEAHIPSSGRFVIKSRALSQSITVVVVVDVVEVSVVDVVVVVVVVRVVVMSSTETYTVMAVLSPASRFTQLSRWSARVV